MGIGPNRGESAGDPLAEGGAAPIAEINVTPLVDVMLVLLVVFMVAAPLMTVGVPVRLPQTAARATAEPDRPLVVSLDAAGRVWFGETPVGIEALAARLLAEAGDRRDRVVLVRADRTASYGQVMDVMGRVAAAGFGRVSLVARAAAVPAGASE